MQHGGVAGYPVKGVRVRLFDGSYHTVDSSEMAFKIAGSIAMQAGDGAGRRRCCWSRSCSSTRRVPEDSVGDVMGDLNSRRGRPLGTEPRGGMTEVKAEVPMAEMLTYAPDLRSITGGQGEYTMEFLRYEEVPAHLAQKVVADRRARGGRRPDAVKAVGEAVARLARVARTRDIRTNQRRHRLRRLRAHAAARRARRALPRRRRAPPGLRAVHRARPARGLDPRVRRRRPRRCASRAARRGRVVHRRLRAPPRARPRGRRRDAAEAPSADAAPVAARPRAASRSASRLRQPCRRAARATSARSRPTPS